MTGEHPIEGFSIGEYMYVFFTTDLNPETLSPKRSILARSNDGGIHFGKPIYTLSTDKFIHVSAQVIDNHVIEGLPEKTGEGDRKSTRLNSSHANISYAVFCLKK